jgi:flavin reductase (DIM6/NTAB) family NADH-FMN oxidoreductase RutF
MLKEVPFSVAMRHKYPEWVTFVTTVEPNGHPDVMVAGWAMIASHNPPHFAIAVGHERYTHTLIRQQREFGIAFPGPDMAEAIRYTGTISGRDVADKFERSGLEAVAAHVIKPPLLVGCPINLECQLAGELEAGDHTIFLGHVVAAHVDESVETHLLNFSGKFFPAKPVE